MKKMYKEPITEVAPIKAENLMGVQNNSIMQGNDDTSGDIE